jgi:hypothetical protein
LRLDSTRKSTFWPSTFVTFICAVYGPSGPVKVQSNSTPTFASWSDGHSTSVGLKLVWLETTSTTVCAAPSGLMVFLVSVLASHPETSKVPTATKTSNGRRIVAVWQISWNATRPAEVGGTGATIPVMGYPASPAATQPTKPPISGVDLAVSIISLVLTLLMGIAAAVLGMFSLAFLDYCPPESCSADNAFTAVAAAVVVALAIGVIGLAATTARLYKRRPAWPFAIATLVLCLMAFGFGVVGYAVAVGA